MGSIEIGIGIETEEFKVDPDFDPDSDFDDSPLL
jgi:hypothetical protein